jgi:hypothetical protein
MLRFIVPNGCSTSSFRRFSFSGCNRILRSISSSAHSWANRVILRTTDFFKRHWELVHPRLEQARTGFSREQAPASRSELLQDKVRAIPLRRGSASAPRFENAQVPVVFRNLCSSPLAIHSHWDFSNAHRIAGQAQGQAGVKAPSVFVGACCILNLHKHRLPPLREHITSKNRK